MVGCFRHKLFEQSTDPRAQMELVNGSFPIWSSYFCGIARTYGKRNTERAIGCVWRTLPVGTGRCLSSSRVAKSAITVRVRRPPHGLLDLELVCYNGSVER